LWYSGTKALSVDAALEESDHPMETDQ